MIQFKCSCGQILRVDDAEAGGATQCPHCGRLRGVPTLDELNTLDDDGTIRLSDGWTGGDVAPPQEVDEDEPVSEADEVAAPPLRLNYARGSTPTAAALQRAARVTARVEPTPAPVPVRERRVERPKYDPETGQRIVPLDLGEARPPEVSPAAPPAGRKPAARPPAAAAPSTPVDPDVLSFRDADGEPGLHRPHSEFERIVPQPIQKPRRKAQAVAVAEAAPVTAQAVTRPDKPQPPRTLSYAGKNTNARRPDGTIPLQIRDVHWYAIPYELLQPANALVLGIVFACHLVSQIFETLAFTGAFILLLIPFAVGMMLLAHYAIVVEETGPEGRDEMPAILRNVSFVDDLVKPLWQLFLAVAISATPAILMVISAAKFGVAAGPTFLAIGLFVLLGLIAFPAVWITTATSGSLHNLLPHRVLGVAVAAGLEYWVAVALLPVTLVVYWMAMALTSALSLMATEAGVSLALPNGTTVSPPAWVLGLIGYPVLALAIYLAHGFCWLLGKIYQDHHERFPWVLQRHVSTRTDPMKELERKKMDELRAKREAHARRMAAGNESPRAASRA